MAVELGVAGVAQTLLYDQAVQVLRADSHTGLGLGPFGEHEAVIALEAQGFGAESHGVEDDFADRPAGGDELLDVGGGLEHGI